MNLKRGSLALTALLLAPGPAWALIGDVPAIRRVSLCPSEPVIDPKIDSIAMLGQNPDGSFVLIVRTFHRETGMQTGASLSVPIPQGTVPVELLFSAAFDSGHVLVLDTALRIHSYGVAFDADGTPKLIGDTPTILGPFGDPAVAGAGTAMAEAPGIDGPPYLAIGTAGGRLILVHGEPMEARTDRIATGPIEDLAAVPQVGYFAFAAVTGGRLVGVNPDGDPAKPGPQPTHTFTCIPEFGWRLRDVAAPPLDAGDILEAPGPVRIAAANGAAAVVVLEIPPSPALGGPLRIRVIDPKNDGIAQVAVGHIEQTDEGMAMVSAAGTGVSFDAAFTMGGNIIFGDVAQIIAGATADCRAPLTGAFVTAVIEVENGFADEIDQATLALTAGASSVLPSPGSTPRLGDEDGNGNPDLTVQFDRLDVLRMLIRERTLDVIATWKFTDESNGRASARVRFVVGAAPDPRGAEAPLEPRRRLHAQQRVVGIEVVEVLGRDDLVPHEDGGRHRALGQDVEGQPDQAVAVLLREVADGGHQRRARLAQLGARVRLGVLAHDGAGGGATGLLEGAGGAQRAGVVGGAHQDVLRLRLAQVPAHLLHRGLELPVAVQ
jgi:hypothetical protein